MYDTLIQLETVDGVRVVRVGNEVDIANAHVLERYLDEAVAGSEAFIVSLERCRYIDSSGLRLLIALAQRFGDAFAVVVPTGTQICRIFDLTRLGDVMNVCGTVPEALRTLRSRNEVIQ